MPPDQPSAPSTDRRRPLAFALLTAAAVVGIVAYAFHARAQLRLRDAPDKTIKISEDRARLDAVRREPYLLFRNIALGRDYGHIAIVPLAAPHGERSITPLAADRVYGSKEGSGFYLRANRRALTSYEAVSFDRNFQVLHTFKLAGAPSRTRVSADGHLASSTVFVAGDSYNTGGFSTRTTLFDLGAGAAVSDLEDFTVQKDGHIFKEPNFNFWGVTFAADHDHFYATLGSGDIPYLIEGHVSRREAQVVRAGVECPSLSPDETRVVFKSRIVEAGRRIWRLHVLNLRTQGETIVAETRNVDDQAEWLDDGHVIYALPRDTGGSGHSDLWAAASDGTGSPQLLVIDASSPCVIRP